MPEVGSMKEYLPGRGAWLQYRGDLANTGVSHSKSIDWSKAGLAWSYYAGASLTATPAFAAGRVIAADELGLIHAVDGKTGKGIWTRRCGVGGAGNGFVLSSPMILNGRIYCATKIGMVYALDFGTGEILWSFQVPEREERGEAARIYSSPKGDERGILISTTGARTWCLDPVTGKPRWHLQLLRETGASAAIMGDNLYIASKDRRLREISYKTGKVLRQVELPASSHSTPCLGLGFAYLITYRATVAIDLTQATPQIVWTGEATSDEKLCGGVSSGRVFFPLGQYMYCMDGPSGEVLWKAKAGHKVGAPVIVGNDVVYAGHDKIMRVADLKTGAERFKIDLGEGFHASPIVVDGTVYLASDVSKGVRIFAVRELAEGEGVKVGGGKR